MIYIIVYIICVSHLWPCCEGGHAQIGMYKELGNEYRQCGYGRESAQFDDSCFEWHKQSDSVPEIWNGRQTLPGEVPYVVFIDITVFDADHNVIDGWECTGSIINENLAVTAAHCFLRPECEHGDCQMKICLIFGQKSRKTIELLVNRCQHGLRKRDPDRIVNSVRTYTRNDTIVKMYPGFLEEEPTHHSKKSQDFSIVYWPQPIVMKDYVMKPICLPPKDIVNDEHEYAMMSGWGVTHPFNVIDPPTTTTTVDQDNVYNDLPIDVQDDYGQFTRDRYRRANGGDGNNDNKVSLDFLPIGWLQILPAKNDRDDHFGELILAKFYPYPGGTVFCMGDSGGPLIQYVRGRAVLIGTVWGDLSLGEGAYPCVYNESSVMAFVRMSKKIDWIIREMANITRDIKEWMNKKNPDDGQLIPADNDKTNGGRKQPYGVASLSSTCNGSHAQIAMYENDLGDENKQCGYGGESSTLENMCFDWNKKDDSAPHSWNGRQILSGEMTYAVYMDVAVDSDSGEEVSHRQCTGSIINEYTAVTAAHCFLKPKECEQAHCLQSICLVFGQKNRETIDALVDRCQFGTNPDEVQLTADVQNYTRKAIGVSTYPGFVQGDYTDHRKKSQDFAIVFWDEPIVMQHNSIKPICLPPNGIVNHNNEYAMIIGWGVTHPHNVNRRPRASINLVNNDNQRRHTRNRYIRARDSTGNHENKEPLDFLAIGWVKILPVKNNQDDYNGDLILAQFYPYPDGNLFCMSESGAPLVQYVRGRAVLIGTLWGDITRTADVNPCAVNKSSVMAFVRVSKKVDWITREMSNVYTVIEEWNSRKWPSYNNTFPENTTIAEPDFGPEYDTTSADNSTEYIYDDLE